MAVNKVVYGTTVLVDLTTDTVTADTLKKGSTAHNSAGELITGTMPTATQATPSISVNSSGLITASSTQSAGYVEAGTKKSTKQLSICEGRTITPSTETQIAITEGQYATGDIDIEGDDRLVPANIKSGVTIFGVTGTYEGSGGGGGGSAETCNVTINSPGQIAVIGWGDGTVTIPALGSSAQMSLPSTDLNRHLFPFAATYNFPSVPVGSTFVFYRPGNKAYIKGATVSDNIEFSFVNPGGTTLDDYNFAICRCNGDGEITINI